MLEALDCVVYFNNKTVWPGPDPYIYHDSTIFYSSRATFLT